MQDLKITIIQTDLQWESKEANLTRLEDKLNLSSGDEDIIVLPEMFNTGFSMNPEKWAEDTDASPTLNWMKERASLREVSLAGSFMVKEKGKYFNRLYFVHPDGSYQCYDKRHLFRMGGEDMHFDQGSAPLIVDYKGWKINFLVCYDLRFPVWSKNNFREGKYDYDLLLVVANWPAVRSRVWKTLLSARAIENQAWVVAVNRIGDDGNGLAHSGNSNIYDPKGLPLFDENDEQEFVKTADLSLNDLNDFREKFTVGLDWDSFQLDLEPENRKSGVKYTDKEIQKNYNG
jgi:omega-amidase